MLLVRERYVLIVVRRSRKVELGLQIDLFKSCEDSQNQDEAVSSISEVNEQGRDPLPFLLIASPPPRKAGVTSLIKMQQQLDIIRGIESGFRHRKMPQGVIRMMGTVVLFSLYETFRGICANPHTLVPLGEILVGHHQVGIH